jgi:hypothetical protein
MRVRHAEPQSMSRAEVLATPIGSLADFWLGLRCALPCTKIAYVPLKLRAARNGTALKLGDALKRLRCNHCGVAPVSASLTDHTNDSDQGGQRSRIACSLSDASKGR